MDPFDPEVFLPVLFVAAHLMMATGVWLCRRRRNARRAVLLGNACVFPCRFSCLSFTPGKESPGFSFPFFGAPPLPITLMLVEHVDMKSKNKLCRQLKCVDKKNIYRYIGLPIFFPIFKHFTIVGYRFWKKTITDIYFIFICHTIIQSITSSEMCSLHLTHPRAHTHTHTHTHLEQWALYTHTHTHTHLEQWALFTHTVWV